MHSSRRPPPPLKKVYLRQQPKAYRDHPGHRRTLWKTPIPSSAFLADKRISHEHDLSVCQPIEHELLQSSPMNTLWSTRDELLKYPP